MDLDCKEVERLKELVPYKILAPTPKEIINYIEKLQSNWNSLRKWLEVNDRYSQGYFKQVLEYMNELEGKDNNE